MKFRTISIITSVAYVVLSASLNAQTETNGIVNETIPELDIRISESQKFVINNVTYEMPDVIRYLIENNGKIKVLLYEAAMADTDSIAFTSKYMPVLFGSADYIRKYYPEDAQTLYSGDSYLEKSGKVGVQKGFSTGTTLSAGIQQKYVNNYNMNPAYGDVEYFQNGYFFSIEQELLKNIFGYQERKQQKMLDNRKNIILDITEYKISLMSLEAVISAWEYAIAFSDCSNAKLKLDETRKVRSIIKSDVDLGANENYSLNYWNALVASHEISYSKSLQSLKEKERDLKTRFNLETHFDEEFLNGSPGIYAVMTNRPAEINFEQALRMAYENRADYTSALLNVKNAELQMEIVANNALPSLKAGLSVSSVGQRDSSSNAYGDAFPGDRINYDASVAMTFPLYDPKQKTDERNAEFQLEQARINLAETGKEIRNDILNSIDLINTAYDAYQKAKKTRTESEQYYRRFKTHLRSGRFSAADVKNALDMMIDSRQGELRALMYYNIALLQFDTVQNSFLKNNGIEIVKIIENQKHKQK
ncbi:MAG: TolC family protein [Spirochaetes bacterium]|nr:TolC family protein [Spirochaetota bacterium]